MDVAVPLSATLNGLSDLAARIAAVRFKPRDLSISWIGASSTTDVATTRH
jgi:hypothetical protein